MNINDTIYEIMVYINLNLFEHITLDSLSQRFSYSKFHLHRKFKEIAGITLNEYIKKRRIENSIYLLFANMNMDISEIAIYCGFSSATYSREFKKVFSRSPKEWRNVYKKGIDFKKDSNICKNYDQFICYSDNGIPKEIKKICTLDIAPIKLSAKIFYGNYYDGKIGELWEEVKRYNKEGKRFYGIPLNSPSVGEANSCIYLFGFENDSNITGLNSIIIDGGSYIKAHYHGSMAKIGEIYTWLIKYYMVQKDLMYDYRIQFQLYEKAPDISQSEIVCQLYIPILHI